MTMLSLSTITKGGGMMDRTGYVPPQLNRSSWKLMEFSDKIRIWIAHTSLGFQTRPSITMTIMFMSSSEGFARLKIMDIHVFKRHHHPFASIILPLAKVGLLMNLSFFSLAIIYVPFPCYHLFYRPSISLILYLMAPRGRKPSASSAGPSREAIDAADTADYFHETMSTLEVEVRLIRDFKSDEEIE
jgi:hypothetical protein